MNKIILLLLPALIFAEEEFAGTNYDITERTINFLLFAGILYYFLANPAKEFYKNRIKSIADSLHSVQDKLIESKEKKEKALKKVEDAKSKSSSILKTAIKEAEVLTKKIELDLENEIKALDKIYVDNMEIEKRKMVREVVAEVVNEVFESDLAKIDSSKFVDIVLKKVA